MELEPEATSEDVSKAVPEEALPEEPQLLWDMHVDSTDTAAVNTFKETAHELGREWITYLRQLCEFAKRCEAKGLIIPRMPAESCHIARCRVHNK
jgi:hypothetical protein